tara:strand:+ start:191 stop:427 length:237 start_codon:yes stop_codon:yes gene_type:complete
MVRSLPVDIHEYETKDPNWWLQKHKNDLAHLCIRTDQLIKAIESEDEDEIKTYIMLTKKLIEVFNKEGVGLYEVLGKE